MSQESQSHESHGRAGRAGSGGRHVLRRAAARSHHVRLASKAAGSLQPKLLAATLAAACAAGGSLAVAHQHRARPTGFTTPQATPAPITAVIPRPQAPPLERRRAVTVPAHPTKGVSAW